MRTTDVRFLDVLRRYLGSYRVEEGPEDILFSADCGIEKQVPGGLLAQRKGKLALDFHLARARAASSARRVETRVTWAR